MHLTCCLDQVCWVHFQLTFLIVLAAVDLILAYQMEDRPNLLTLHCLRYFVSMQDEKNKELDLKRNPTTNYINLTCSDNSKLRLSFGISNGRLAKSSGKLKPELLNV